MKYKTVDVEQGSDLWHEFRKGKIGASDIPSIANIHGAYGTRQKLLEEKLGMTTVIYSEFTQKLFDEGHQWEEIVRQEVNKSLGNFVPAVVQSEIEPGFFASLDGIDFPASKILEIKSTVKKEFIGLVVEGSCPPVWNAQIQWQLFITGFQDAILAVVDRGNGQVFHLNIKRDPDLIVILANAAQEFLNDMKAGNTGVVEAFESDANLCRLIEIKRILRTAEDTVKKFEAEAKTIAADLMKHYKATKLVSDKISIETIERAGSVDYSKIPELAGVDLEKYRKKGTTHFRVTLSKSPDLADKVESAVQQITKGNDNE